jgi:hypothetical protein
VDGGAGAEEGEQGEEAGFTYVHGLEQFAR